MKLITADASPFVRKVRVLIIELGLQDAVTLVDPGPVNPIVNNDNVNALNPLGMIPALELDDGGSLYDSAVICEYLNQLAEGPFFPSDSGRRFRTLRLQALGDGLLDISVALRYQTALRQRCNGGNGSTIRMQKSNAVSMRWRLAVTSSKHRR